MIQTSSRDIFWYDDVLAECASNGGQQRLCSLLADTPPTADAVRLSMLMAARKNADAPIFYPAEVVGVSMQPVSFQVRDQFSYD